MSAATTAPSGGNNVLSDKVSRALHVRTDTPAMRAALDALAGLPTGEGGPRASSSGGGGAPSTTTATAGSGSGGVIDARSVRAAIEEDALRRALDFQSELRRLAGDATALRERVDRVAGAASLVRRRVEGQILEAGAGGEMKEGEEDDRYAAAGGSSSSAGDAWEEERTLASRLAVAQKACVEAARRQKAVDAFLDKFDLGEDEARLLDHYNFEGFVLSEACLEGEEGSLNPWGHPSAALHIAPDPSAGAVDEAMAFLDALERLAVIRRELTKAFGSGGGGGAGDEFDNEASFDGDDHGGADEASGSSGQLGTHSALRMMEHLASRQERAHERLYLFVQFFLGIGSAAPSSSSSSHAPTSSADQYSGRPSLPSAAAPHGALGRFRDGDEVDEAYNHPVVRRALHALRHSRSRRAHALELVAAGRRTEVTRRFLLALTSGYGGAAPLEMGAHDPVGYVGDMLAFAFRAFRVEGELVRTLFEWKDAEGEGGGDEGNDGEGGEKNEENAQVDAAMDEDEGGDEEGEKPMDVAEMLAQSMGGLARPLRTRVSQVVHSLASQGGEGSGHGQGEMMPRAGVDDDASSSSSLNRLVALFSVCGLIRFYGSAVEKALDKLEGSTPENPHGDNPFFTTCDECLAEAADSYVASLRAFGAMLGTHSLSSAESEAQLANRAIVRISEERVASPGFAEDIAPAAEAEDEVSKQLSLPFLVAIMVEAAVPHLKTLDDCAALKSALGVSTKCGLKASESTKWSELIQGTETNLVESFVDAETDEVLQVCGLEGLRSALRHMDGAYVEGMTMASHPGLSQASVEAAMKKFYSSLYSPPIPTFEESIRDAELRKVARSKTAERVVDVYRELYEAIMSEKGGYDDISFLGHTPTQVKTLLSM